MVDVLAENSFDGSVVPLASLRWLLCVLFRTLHTDDAVYPVVGISSRSKDFINNNAGEVAYLALSPPAQAIWFRRFCGTQIKLTDECKIFPCAVWLCFVYFYFGFVYYFSLPFLLLVFLPTYRSFLHAHLASRSNYVDAVRAIFVTF